MSQARSSMEIHSTGNVVNPLNLGVLTTIRDTNSGDGFDATAPHCILA